MSESKKLLIGFAIVGFICCCLAGTAFWGFGRFANNIEQATNGDPTQIAKAQDNIADFDIPASYKPMAMSMFVYDMLYLTPEEPADGVMIMLMQYSSASPTQQMEEQLKQTAEQQNNQPGMQVVDTIEKVIRGQTVTVTVSETSNNEFTMRQWMTVFQGNKGPVVLMIQGSVETWDEQLIEDFINSIE